MNGEYELPPKILLNYRRTLSFSFVTSYILGLGDRHLGNVLLLPNGAVRNVDFEFVFGEDPKFYEELRVHGIAEDGVGDGWEDIGEGMYMALRGRWKDVVNYFVLSGWYLYGEDEGRRKRMLGGLLRRLMMGRGEMEARRNWGSVVRNAKNRWLGAMAVDVMHGWGGGD